MFRSIRPLALVLSGLALGCSDPGAKRETPGSSASAPGSASPSGVGEAAARELDTTKLTAREKRELVGQLGEVGAPCSDTPVSLGVCLAEKRACSTCKPAADFLAKLVRQGMPRPDRKKVYEARFDPKAVSTIELGDAAIKGPADAPVTIVEWADFECPHCAMMREVLDIVQERFPGQIRVAYKLYALPSHTHAKDAALAAVAAQRQGKFWEMHQRLFVGQDKLERQDLLRYAKDLELDMTKFKADFEAETTLQRLESDMKQGDSVGLDGTPLIFVNGRKVALEALNPFFDEFIAWIALELELAGKTPAEPSEKYKEFMKKAEEAAKSASSAAPDASAAPAASAAVSAAASASAAPSATASAAPSAAASAAVSSKR